jgi:hypothetical protein
MVIRHARAAADREEAAPDDDPSSSAQVCSRTVFTAIIGSCLDGKKPAKVTVSTLVARFRLFMVNIILSRGN